MIVLSVDHFTGNTHTHTLSDTFRHKISLLANKIRVHRVAVAGEGVRFFFVVAYLPAYDVSLRHVYLFRFY